MIISGPVQLGMNELEALKVTHATTTLTDIRLIRDPTRPLGRVFRQCVFEWPVSASTGREDDACANSEASDLFGRTDY